MILLRKGLNQEPWLFFSWGMTASWHVSMKQEAAKRDILCPPQYCNFFLTTGLKTWVVNLRSSWFFLGYIKRPSHTWKIVLILRTGFWPDETGIIDIAKGVGQTVGSTLDLLRSSLPVRPRMLLATKQLCSIVSFRAFLMCVCPVKSAKCAWVLEGFGVSGINQKIGSISLWG